MGNLSTTHLIYIVLIQVILLLCSFLWYILYKLKKLNNKPAPKPPAPAKVIPQGDSPKDYLQSEVASTSQQIQENKQSDADKDISGLKLRLELLNFELENLTVLDAHKKAKTQPNWDDINQKLYKILSSSGFMRNTNHLKKALDEEDKNSPTESLLEQQSKTIVHLKEFINGLLTKIDSNALPNNELDEHFSNLEHAKIELEQCVLILEDENSFLRDQIAALLKVQANNDS